MAALFGGIMRLESASFSFEPLNDLKPTCITMGLGNPGSPENPSESFRASPGETWNYHLLAARATRAKRPTAMAT